MYKLEIRTGLKRGEADIHTLLIMWRLTCHRMSKLSRVLFRILCHFFRLLYQEVIHERQT